MATTQIEKSDPVVLGVSIPLTVTVSAAKQVGSAWKEFGSELVHALSQARESTKGAIKSKTKAEGRRCAKHYQLSGTFPQPRELRAVAPGDEQEGPEREPVRRPNPRRGGEAADHQAHRAWRANGRRGGPTWRGNPYR